MQKKFLTDIIILITGKQAEKIAEILDEKKYTNEFIIAKKLEITINQTRNILYKLADEGLVSSTRKKDKKKGWYTYFWKIELVKSLDLLKRILEKHIEQINTQIKSRETKQFYTCETCKVELTEEKALLHDFTCNECGGIYTLKDNTKNIKELKKEKEKAQKELELVNKELELELKKVEKKKERERKKEAKEKAKKREEKRLERKKLAKKKTKKKIVKKKTKKKAIKKKAAKKKTVKKISKKKTKKKK